MFSFKSWLLVPVCAGLLSACGPARSTALIVDADVQLQAAKTAGASKYAPYEFTAATLYLEKAREEVGYSDYEVAVDFARKAAQFAKEARTKALDHLKKELPPEDTAP